MPTYESDGFWESELTLVTPGTSDAIIIPGWLEGISVAVFPEAGASAKAMFCLDPEERIENDPGNVRWLDWSKGFVTSGDSAPGNSTIVGVRLVSQVAGATLQVAGTRRAVRIR